MEASAHIDQFINDLGDWRGKKIAEIRKAINSAVPGLTEDWKWDTPVWTQNGNVCAVGSFKDHIKINFFKGASLPDPEGLFNSGLEAKKTRSIDLFEGDSLDKKAFRDLVKKAADLNK